MKISGNEIPDMEADLRPHLAVLLGGSILVALISIQSLPWPAALASIVLGILMIAGAEIDARTFLLPDVVTLGALFSGILAALALNPHDPGGSACAALLRALVTAAGLLMVRWCYKRLRGQEGLGLGDVKLAAGIGAWLPFEAIPRCFALATVGALVLVLISNVSGRRMRASTRLPFGAFLCPALWLIFYIGMLPGQSGYDL
jgi:leader peptidase (prepilin peptidase)/N-methyltransferase